jgi:hypothetical protein
MRRLCTWVCPQRTLVRGAFNALLVVGVVAFGLFLLNCRVRALGWRYIGALVAGGALTFLVFMLLLNCDPDLYTFAQGNALLWGILAALSLGAVWLLFLRRSVPAP